MITLINGRGQLGEALKEQIKECETEKNVFIYHTWNVWDKKKDSQKKEFNKFKAFVDKNRNNGRIIFISTYSENDNHYVHYKQKSESYLLLNCEDCLVLRLPSLIGKKGIFQRLKNKECNPYGMIEIMTLHTASKKIMEFINYDGLGKSFTIVGEKISVTTLNELIHLF
tara:strand:- start:416 stop:922 length:507 start_codon:yes stop_codon:yes gene_type:complete